MTNRVLSATTVAGVHYAIKTSRNNGRVFVPVAPASYVYSHFKHISGTPALEGQHGVSLNKLKMLDVLIEQLSHMKQHGVSTLVYKAAPSNDRIDALIEHYEDQIRSIQTAGTVPYHPVPPAPTGVVVNLIA
jgi:hypothetical protein